MAIKRFEMKRLSSGQAALRAGLDRTAFLMRLAENGVAMIGHDFAGSRDTLVVRSQPSVGAGL
jgi:hypothetical protein